MINILQTIIIAIVEGLTEYLPVSSTGHMIIAQKILNVPSSDLLRLGCAGTSRSRGQAGHPRAEAGAGALKP